MALTRKFLSALGIEAEKIDEIISSHTETVEGLKDEIKKYKDDATRLAETEKELSEAKKELETLKADTSGDDLKTKYSALEKEYKEYKNSIKEKETLEKKEVAFRKALKDAGISEKRFDAIVKISGDDINKIELDGDGNVKNVDDLSKSINDNWSDFKQTESIVGAGVATPPATKSGADKKPSRAAMIATQYHENLYGKVKED